MFPLIISLSRHGLGCFADGMGWDGMVLTSSRNYGICVGTFIAVFALVWWWADARGYVLLV